METVQIYFNKLQLQYYQFPCFFLFLFEQFSLLDPDPVHNSAVVKKQMAMLP